MTTIQEAFKELRLEELKQKRAINEAKQKEDKKKIQESIFSNVVPDPSEIPQVSTVKNALSRTGKSLAQLGEEAEAKEDVCPECGKKVCECDKQPVEECNLQEAIEDEVNNGEIYSPDDVTDEEIDDMLDWMLHNGHYGKYTYNLDTVEGYQRLVSDAALNMISDEGIEPKSALARDLRSTSEFKEWEQAVAERLKAVYGVDPHDFDADLVEDVEDEIGAPLGDIASQYKSSPVRDALKPDTQARELTQAQLNSRFTQGDLNSARDHKRTVVNNSPEYEVRKLFNRYPIDLMLRRSQLDWDDIDGIANYYITTTYDGPYLTDDQIAYLKAKLPEKINKWRYPKRKH